MQFAHSRQNAEALKTAVSTSFASFSTAATAPVFDVVPAAEPDLHAPCPLRQSAANPPSEIMDRFDMLLAQGIHKECGTLAAQLLNRFPESPFLWDCLGRSQLKRNALDQAKTCLNRAMQLCPESPATLSALGDVWRARGSHDKAEHFYLQALTLPPQRLETLNSLGNLLSNVGRITEGLSYLEQAHRLAPDNAVVTYNLANALRRDAPERAIALYQKALRYAPDLRQARSNLARLLAKTGEREAALEHIQALTASAPDDDRERAQELHLRAQLNDWSLYETYEQCRRQIGLRGSAVSPFAMLGLEDNPDLQRVRTRAYAAQAFAQAETYRPKAAHVPNTRPAKLRIGYFSADFHSHATMFLMAGLFEQHDPSRFEIHAFSYGPDREDDQRQRLLSSVEHFHECADMTDQDLIAFAQSKDLDIAVDLKGYTGANRCELFAKRLGTLHVSFLGYPGTMGTPAFDYIVTDSVLTPPGSERHFDEYLLRLPHCYQPNDDQRKISPRQFTRDICGLPETGFVFACFNNSYKITPAEFDIWMPLLTEVEGSVLWLLSNGPTSEANLRREAAVRGVDPARLIFAERLPQDEHLARQKVADLFLDTFNYNAHTTCSDALWAGLPILTLPGQQFAARVGASLVTACGLPELIAKDRAEYRQMALDFARKERALLGVHSRLRTLRRTTALFDTKGYVRGLEQGFDAIMARHLAGELPEHVTVTEPTVAPVKAASNG